MNIIEYIIREKGLKQKDIAREIGISPAQLTKMKKAEWLGGKPRGINITDDQKDKLYDLSGMKEMLDEFDGDSDWALIVDGKKSNADAWCKYILTRFKEDELWEMDALEFEIETQSLLKNLVALGATIPSHPDKLERIKWIEDGKEEVSVPFEIFFRDFAEDYVCRLDWYETFINVNPAGNDYDEDEWEIISDLQWVVGDVALINAFDFDNGIGVDQKKFSEFEEKTIREAKNKIVALCVRQQQLNIPLKRDYFTLVAPYHVVFRDLCHFQNRREENPMEMFLSYEHQTSIHLFTHLSKMIEGLHEKIDRLSAALPATEDSSTKER